MSDQENRNPQQSDPQKAVAEQGQRSRLRCSGFRSAEIGSWARGGFGADGAWDDENSLH